ncbi:glycosyltransferase [Proteus mirabilis]|uniref:glycosyltransferase n=2 Tax=Proteus mirabilis TaxID=584 RepID=UPI00117AF7FF|nr:glycosyltransferase [Proteus mirabilis]EKV4066625.1 glycosyltransferase [Proteus mirabilis]ELW9233919.1 glycosyltransferase [Proteus mirabilis]EMB6139899.1 glycosyltransferase [Proteus mirabilis]MBB6688635.1 glycosyltransferase [Proteus mirabilis]MBG2763771.1 glycosyltransferase [Proteus mirabilis]
MSIKKIVIVGIELQGLGGMEVVFNKLNDLLKEHYPNISLSIILLKERDICINENWHKNLNVRFIRCKIRNHKIRRFMFSCKLSGILRKDNPDIIIASDVIGCYIANLASKFSLRNIPVFSWIHTSLWTAYKAVYTLNVNYHIPISSGNKKYLLNHNVPESHINVVYNPVDRTDKIIHRPSNKIKFLYIGRLLSKESKNLEFMFYALGKLKGNWELHLVGDGKDRSKLFSLAQKLQIDKKVIFHGWQDNAWDYVLNHIKEVTACLLTSTHEGLPMVLIEAQSYGIYCVSSDCLTGPSDIIDGDNGQLFPVNDELSFLKILNDIINGRLDLPEYSKIKKSIKKFYGDVYIKNMIDFFEKKSKKIQ